MASPTAGLAFAFVLFASPACWAHDSNGSKPGASQETCASIRLAAEQSIRQLKASTDGAQDLASASNMVVFLQRLMGQSVSDPDQAQKNQALRQDIERDKSTLRARGCDTQELDSELPSHS